MDACVFDAYGTLFDVHSVARRCETLWPGKGAALSQAWRSKQLEYTWLRNLMGRYAPFSQVTRDALAWAVEHMNLQISSSEVEDLMREYLRLETFPEVAEALKALPGRKAILSNGSPDMLDPLVAHSGLKLDAVLSVDAVKVYKPDARVYQQAVSFFGIEKAKITFVSSNGWDAQGAKSFGFRVIWVNRAGAPVDRLGFAPDRIVRDLRELG